MKTYFKFLIFLLLLIFSSCSEPTIGFVTHQPSGVKSKTLINSKLIGEYVVIDTSVFLVDFHQTYSMKKDTNMKWKVKNVLTIMPEEIVNTLEGELLVLKSSLDSTDRNKLLYFHDIDSTIVQYLKNPTYHYTIDSVEQWYKISFSIRSQLFKISPDNVYKEFRWKYYFNSFEKGSGYWTCTQFDYNPKLKVLSINSTSQDDISIIERLTEIEQHIEKNDKNINPSKRTFKKFLRMKGFEDKIKLKRLK
jgi:hypothetical protein